MLAVDPSSPFSGGALLGDRVRMREHATDTGVFIRSMATRGHLGGLAWATPQALRVLDAAGCDVVLVETVGVGQSEIEVVALADTTVVLLAPGMGDGDPGGEGRDPRDRRRVRGEQGRPGRRRPDRARPAAHAVARRRAVRGAAAGGPPVVRTVAARGEGMDELVAALDEHRDWWTRSGERERRRLARAEAEIEAIALEPVRARIGDVRGGAGSGAGQTGGGGRAGPVRARPTSWNPGSGAEEGRRRPGIVGGAG